MSITRANAGGWATNAEEFTAQQNAIDKNTTYMLDKRVNKTDTLASDITVVSGGQITFNIGSTLVLDPSVVSVSSGNLKIGAELNGDSSQNDTLRFGYNTILLTTTTLTLSNTQYNKFNLKFSGVSLGEVTVTLPSVAGYTKLIDNQCTGTGGLTVITSMGAGIRIPNGYAALIYCDGANISMASNTIQNRIISEQSISYDSIAKEPLASTTNTNYAILNSKNGGIKSIICKNVNIGDVFEIFMSTAVVTAFHIYATGSVIPSVGYGSFYTSSGTNIYTNNQYITEMEARYFQLTTTTIYQDYSSSIFTATVAGQHEFFINYAATEDLAQLIVYSPTTLKVVQYRS